MVAGPAATPSSLLSCRNRNPTEQLLATIPKPQVLCCDEKSQCQALERTQPDLPLGIGHIRTKTHDYVRHGTITSTATVALLGGTEGSQTPRWRRESRRSLLAVTAAASLGDSQERQRLADRAPDVCPGCGGRMEPIGPFPRSPPVRSSAWHDSS